MGRAESPIVAHSPGQRPGWSYSAINTFGIFALAQKCHAPRARNSRRQCHGALPLIMKAALTERDALIHATSLPRALPGAMCNNWACSPPHLCSQHSEHGAFNPLVYIKCPFLNIFGCARHSSNKFGSALVCAKILEISATDKVAILPVERD